MWQYFFATYLLLVVWISCLMSAARFVRKFSRFGSPPLFLLILSCSLWSGLCRLTFEGRPPSQEADTSAEGTRRPLFVFLEETLQKLKILGNSWPPAKFQNVQNADWILDWNHMQIGTVSRSVVTLWRHNGIAVDTLVYFQTLLGNST